MALGGRMAGVAGARGGTEGAASGSHVPPWWPHGRHRGRPQGCSSQRSVLESNCEMVGPVLSTNRIGWPPWSLTKALSTRLRALASWLLGVEGMNKTVSGVWFPAVVVEARSQKMQFGFLWPHKEEFQTMKMIDYMLQVTDQRHRVNKIPHIESGIK